jgi:hypothetical protein
MRAVRWLGRLRTTPRLSPAPTSSRARRGADAVALPFGNRRRQRAGGNALEASVYHYPGGASEERFVVHRTVFPSDLLAEFGFRTLRRVGRVELARLDLGGLQTVTEKGSAKLIGQIKELLQPAPIPQRP